MAGPKFVNKQPGVNPQLTPYDPSALPAGQSSMESFADIASMGLKGAKAIQEDNVDTLTDKAATALSEEYLLGSETYQNDLNQRKLRLESQVQTDGANTVLLKELDDVVGRLELAKEQDRIGPGEFRYRAMAKSAELYDMYPSYKAEIDAKMNAVFGQQGVDDILASDSSLLKIRQEAAIKRETDKRTFVGEYMDITSMSQDDINKQFSNLKNIEGSDKFIQLLTTQMQNQDNFARTKIYRKFISDGGIGQLYTSVFGGVSKNLRQIGSLPNEQMNIDDKIDLASEEINVAIARLYQVQETFPSGATQGTAAVNQLITNLQALEGKLKDKSLGTNRLAVVSNSLERLTKTNQLNLNRKYNVPEINFKADILEKLSKVRGGVGAMNTDAIIMELGKNIITSVKGITTTDIEADVFAGPGGIEEPIRISRLINEETLSYLKKEGELPKDALAIYNTALTLPASGLTGPSLMKFQDNNLKPFIQTMPEEVLKELINNQDFARALKGHLDVYTKTASEAVYSVMGDNQVVMVNNKTDNSLYVSQEGNPNLEPVRIEAINNALKRVIDIAIIENKVTRASGMKQNIQQTVLELVQESFPQLKVK